MTVNTKTSPRRDVTFATLADVERDLDLISNALESGSLNHTGNWTPGQICEHCAKFMRFAIDGFPSNAPPILRVVMRMMFFKRAMGPEPLPAGFKLPKSASALLPSDSVTDATGIAELRAQIKRVRDGAKFTSDSPIFGKVSHDQWMIVQLKHCAMHLSFISMS